MYILFFYIVNIFSSLVCIFLGDNILKNMSAIIAKNVIKSKKLYLDLDQKKTHLQGHYLRF